MLLCGHGTDEALEIAEKLLHELNSYRFVWEDKRLSVAVSIGMVLIKGHGQNVSKLLQDAEASCGVAKEIGGHRVQVYHEGHARLNKHNAEVQWASQIDKALDDSFATRYLGKHPYLESFIKSPTCAWIRTDIASYYLVRRFQNVMELHLDQ